MSWGLGWKRPSEIFRLTLNYGNDDLTENLGRDSSTYHSASSSTSSSFSSSPTALKDQELGFRIELDWSATEDEEQAALKLQSQLMVALPMTQDTVVVELRPRDPEDDAYNTVNLDMKVVKKRDPLRAVTMIKAVGSGQQSDGTGVLIRLFRSDLSSPPEASPLPPRVADYGDHWKSFSVLTISGCGLSVFPVELTRLPNLEKLYLDNNKLTVLPPELGELRRLKVLSADNNMLVSVPVELRQCVQLVELSLEYNKLVRPLLDFRAMAELRVLRLFGNPLEFLPEILPLRKLRHLTLANIRVVADEKLRSVNVEIEMENSSYFVASRHKLSAAFSLIFRFSSCHHPLLASALGKIMQDEGNRVFVGKDENAVRQLISMITSDNCHVVGQACSALSALASDDSVALQLMRADIMRPIGTVLKSACREDLISVLQVVVKLAFTSNTVAEKMLTKDVLKSLKILCAHKDPEVQKLALLAVGNLAFSLENRQILVTSESLRELLLRLAVVTEPRVYKAAARALAILGENENLRRAIRGRKVAKQGLRILSMDGGGMKGLATVKMLREIEKGTGKRIHELFDLICGTSTGGMLAVALGIKLMTLEECEDIYKNLGKLVFAEPSPKENESATWREKLDQLYKSSSQSFRVVVHGSKHGADLYESLLKEMCADEDGDLLIDSAVKNVPKVFVVSTLVSMMPAQPFIFRNYQYPTGTPEVTLAMSESSGVVLVSPTDAQVGYTYKRSAFIGSCKHQIWKAIRASSAAPYYLDDFSDDVNRWQDGAIVANNPTIFAIREAQLLWPDTKIDCLVSVGCGDVPPRMRKGGWRYLDTGQVLIESSCSVDRVEEALSTLLPMLPEIQYFSFQSSSPTLGWRRNVLLVEASHSPDSGSVINHARVLESFCALPSPTNLSPYASPVFPSSPRRYSPDSQRIGRIDLVPALSLDSQLGKPTTSPPVSPRGLRLLSSPVRQLHDKLQNTPQVGVVHLALQSNSDGLIMSWHNDVFVVAEPGELATKFVESVKLSLLSTMRNHRRKGAALLANIVTVSDLVAFKSYFHIGGIVHRYLGCQTIVVEDDREISSYTFRRTVPSMQLSANDVRWMVGAWRDRIIICTGTYGPTPALVKAFMDGGAKAVVCPSNEPPLSQVTFDDNGELNVMENGRFELGEDEGDDDVTPASPESDWEDSDVEKNGTKISSLFDNDEEELSQFICELYKSLFREGASVLVAFQEALASHRRLGYACHLPSID
ncbi:Phospholipase A I [Arachis hypogaea]|nr:Phospholipase A I [Arachis hypogaea]